MVDVGMGQYHRVEFVRDREVETPMKALFPTAAYGLALLEGEGRALRAVPMRFLRWLTAGGALLYGGVGVVSMLAGGNFLDYSPLSSDPVKGQQLGIILIEAGVGMTVTGVLLSIFHAFAARERA